MARDMGSGQGVTIGVVDTGIDWSHGGFLADDGGTRIAWLMDVSLPVREQEHADLAHFGGAIWDASEIDLGRAEEIEISSIDRVGHGTHVAGIATARGASTSLEADGVAPDDRGRRAR